MEDDIGVTLTAIPTRIAYNVSVSAVPARSLWLLGREAVVPRNSWLRLLDLNRHFTPITFIADFIIYKVKSSIYHDSCQ